ncbi:hypothetical protein TRFO_01600 [Tritrichomonas foetus]|uniref:Raptor N-terminal CASPase-like domain-containing protein n=1 Tax=Tritrichomonas foetus TaxID=1144522 RepID=A0A1J4K2A6_9EUKA|nr:hypothetical protein TRFO_01600 [Tritrichomonas foetus]|eukprot:OHT03870.1 hypothetical protein TRFO_01600 [Tritrichomonas foetus]
MIPIMIFNDWSHLYFAQDPYPPTIKQICPKLPAITKTTSAFISISLPNFHNATESQNQQPIYFWNSIDPTPDFQSEELRKVAVSTYKSRFLNLNVTCSINTKSDFFHSLFSKQIKDPNKRTLVHFILDSSQDSRNSDSDRLKTLHYFHSLNLSEIIKSTIHCGVHIIDCDYSGTLYPTYNDSFEDYEFTMQQMNFFAFFSCSGNQKVPQSPGLPNDLFSSCLITPAKMALLWHSRHYFCFSAGSLTPLTIEQVNNAPREILNDLLLSLKRNVQAMLINYPYFAEIFQTDDVIADIISGYFLAEHIFQFFKVTPLSYPPLPSMANHKLWFSFDLQLDATLLELNNHLKNMDKFNAQNSSLTNSTNALLTNTSFPITISNNDNNSLLYMNSSFNNKNSSYTNNLNAFNNSTNTYTNSSSLNNSINFNNVSNLNNVSNFNNSSNFYNASNCNDSSYFNNTSNTENSFNSINMNSFDSESNSISNINAGFSNVPNLRTSPKIRSSSSAAALISINFNNNLNSTLCNNFGFTLCNNSNVNLSDSSIHKPVIFHKHSLTTIQLLIKAESPPEEFAPHLAFLPSCLSDCNLYEESICILTTLLNMGLPFIQIAAKFPIFPSLVRLAKNGDLSNNVIYCLSKLYTFYPGSKDLSSIFFTSQYLNSFVVPHLRSEQPLSALVLFSMILKNSVRNCDSVAISYFLKCNYISITECLLQSSDSNVRVWTLLFVSTFAQFITQDDSVLKLLDAISTAADDHVPEVRAAFLFAFQSFNHKCLSNNDIFEYVKKFENELHPAVRRELAVLIGSKPHFLSNKELAKMFNSLINDPHKSVSFITSLIKEEEIKKEEAQEKQNHQLYQNEIKEEELKQYHLTFYTFLDNYLIPKAINRRNFESEHAEKVYSCELKKIRTDTFSTYSISSNLAVSVAHKGEKNDNCLIFGTDKGEVIISMNSLSSSPSSSSSSFSAASFQSFCLTDYPQSAKINHIQYLQNSGNPVLLTSNQNGDFYAYSIKSRKDRQSILTAFNFPFNMDSIKFECSQFDTKMYCYSPNKIILCDLNSEKIIGECNCNDDNFTNIHSIPHLSHCVLICHDILEVHDFRTSFYSQYSSNFSPSFSSVSSHSSSFVINSKQNKKILDCQAFIHEPFLISVCNKDGSVFYSDIRMNKVIKSYDCSIGDTQSLCFDVDELTFSSAVGTTKGACVFDYLTDKRYAHTYRQKYQKPINQIKWMSHKYGIVMRQGNNEIVSWTDC